ncbi:arginase family enzyme [Rhizobium tibeticum]|nr:arginase family enzyme [Rhizobium tibeticum]
MPDRILTIGGNCLVDLAPIAYLNKRYNGRLGVLWIDAHPDVQTFKETHQGNAQVLGMLLGRGDPDFVAEVDVPSILLASCVPVWMSDCVSGHALTTCAKGACA